MIGKPSAEMNIADLAFPICQNCVMSSSIMIHHTEAPTMEALAPHECMDQAEGGEKKQIMSALSHSVGLNWMKWQEIDEQECWESLATDMSNI